MSVAPNLLYYGDNLDVLQRHVKDESVDLVYLDPPFNSNRSYNVIFAQRDTHTAYAYLRENEASARPIRVLVAFNEAVSGITPHELDADNARVLAVESRSTVSRFLEVLECDFNAHVLCVWLQPTGDNGERLTLSIPANIADGGNEAADDIYYADITRNPLITTLSQTPTGTVKAPFTLRVDFSHPVLARLHQEDLLTYDVRDYFRDEDVVVTNGTLSSLAIDINKRWATVGILPRSLFKGTLTIELPADAIRTQGGDGNQQCNAAQAQPAGERLARLRYFGRTTDVRHSSSRRSFLAAARRIRSASCASDEKVQVGVPQIGWPCHAPYPHS